MGIGFIIRIGATLILLAFAFLLALAALGYSDILLRALNIPAMRPFFADLRTIPSVEQFALHDNIRAENFSDPWGRPFNYPKVWVYLLQPFRVCSDAYFCLGSLQVLLFLGLVIGLVWRVSSPLTVVPILLLALSPPITLLLERGNTDGLIFLLVLLSVYWGGPFRTPFLIALAAGLKVFPVTALLVVYQSRNAPRFALALAMTSPLLIATFTDFGAIFAATPVSDNISFGVTSFALLLGSQWQSIAGSAPSGRALVLLSATLFVFAILLAYVLFRPAYHRLAEKVRGSPQTRQILLIFGVIFLSTMLVSSNWAYRIVFLSPVAVLTMSWLFDGQPKPMSDWLLLVGLTGAQFGAFWSFLAPYGHLLFNAATFVAAASLAPLITLVAYDHMASLRTGLALRPQAP